MRKTIVLFLLIIFVIPSLRAQTEQERINAIKKSLNFIYASATSTVSAQEATENAKELLSLEIDQWLKEVSDSEFSGYVAKAKNKVEEIATQRGKLMRSFVFVKKTDILPYYKEETIMMVSKEDKPSMDSLKLSAGLSEVQNAEALRSTYNKAQETQTLQNPAQVTQQAVPIFVPSSAEREMLNVRNLSEINHYLSQGDRDGTITGYGKYDSTTSLVGKSYLYLINKEGNVIALLRKEGPSFINLSSGESVSINNYGRCGVIWFQIKEK